MLIEVKEVQSRNASDWIFVRVVGKVTLAKEEHPRKAPPSTVVMPSGITNDLRAYK